MNKERKLNQSENRLQMNEWYRKHRPLHQSRLIVTGVDESVRTMTDLLSWHGGPNHAVLRVMSTCADLRTVHLGNSLLAMRGGDLHPLMATDDLSVEFFPTITEGLIKQNEAPFAWIHVGHGDFDGETSFLSDGPEGDGAYLETQSIAVALESMKGVCSLICLPVCHSHFSKLIFDACKNTLIVSGSARDFVTEIESQCNEACLPYSLLKAQVKSKILDKKRHA
ncbi:hypothetical protein OAC38_02615 [Candidatus Poseidoniaceae archaeon]|nr:hypothetical protein [Candidatus Poseidoniaceae archaeon]